MKKVIWKLTLCLIFVYSYEIAADPAIDITGHYRCRGNNFLNNTKFDEPTVVKKTGDTFSFIWENEGITFYGTAIVQGKTVTSVWWSPADPCTPGVVTYQVLPNGDLKGKWTIKASKIVGDEYCEKLKI